MTHEYKFTLEWEQVDSLVAQELKRQIEGFSEEANSGSWMHPDDVAYAKEILPAMLMVYEYWAGKEAAESLKQNIAYDRIGS